MTIMIMRGGFAITIFACAFALSGCGGGGSIIEIDYRNHELKGEAKGWGFTEEAGAQGKAGYFKLTRDSNYNMKSIEIDGHVFDKNCDKYNLESKCEDSEGNVASVYSLYDYDYIVTANWVPKGKSWPKKAYIGADIPNISPSNVKISGSYKGKAEILYGNKKSNPSFAMGDLKLNINNNKVSGTVQNFRKDPYGSNLSLSGRFDINGSVSGNRLSASFGGNLNGEEIVRSKSRMEGGFFGPKGEEVGGGLSSETKKGTLIRGLWHAKK